MTPVKTLALDIGGTGLKAGILDAKGVLITEHARVETPKHGKPDAVLDALLGLVAPLGDFDRISVGFPRGSCAAGRC